jgi:hypothetical protein
MALVWTLKTPLNSTIRWATSETTILWSDWILECNWTFNVNLPSAWSVSDKIFIIKNVWTWTITIIWTIDWEVNPTLSVQYQSITFQSDWTDYNNIWFF